MSYRALSLKWRPQKFNQLEGQKSVQKILTNAIRSGSIHPVFIFSGPRGTGKTSTARIFAKALRCSSLKQGEPCDECHLCHSIQEGQDMDVMEIDGASSGGVEAIRELKESVQYMPTLGSRKIYIIDEVHMLSQSAFNALLKTLEEPPTHVIFVLATTEIKKIPETVISRCQVINFYPILSAVIQNKMKNICQKEGIQIEEKALWLIAQQSQNSLRDALVLLDQMACLENKNISAQSVRQTLSLTSRAILNDILQSIILQDTQKILSILESLPFIDAQSFLKNLLVQIRNLLLIKLISNPSSSLVFLIDEERDFLKQLSKKISTKDLHRLFDVCLKGNQDLNKSFDPQITLEMVLLRMGDLLKTEEKILSKKTPPSPRIKSQKEEASRSNQIPPKKKEEAPLLKSTPVQSAPKKTENIQTWQNFIQFVRKQEYKIARDIKSFSICYLKPSEVTLGYPEKATFLKEKTKNSEFRKKVENYLELFFKQKMRCQFIQKEKESIRKQDHHQSHKEQIQQAQSHPLTQKMANLFQAQVKWGSKKSQHLE